MGIHEEARRTDDVPIEKVDHPKWTDAHVRPLAVGRLTEFLSLTKQQEKAEGEDASIGAAGYAFLTCYCLCDVKGVLVFSTDDLQWIKDNKTIALLEPVAEAAIKLMGLTNEAADDIAKN